VRVLARDDHISQLKELVIQLLVLSLRRREGVVDM
jgi:hypothetical protein